MTSDRFQQLAERQAAALGHPHLRLEVVPHPLAGLDAESAVGHGRSLAERIVRSAGAGGA